MPAQVGDLNGVAYPQACYGLKDENHFFVIGDWGGMCGWGGDNHCGMPGSLASAPYPMVNGRAHSQFVEGVDNVAQQEVAAAMGRVAAQTPPEFVITVGDHFYPGGVAEHCNGLSSSVDQTVIPSQFQSTFEDIYTSPDMEGKEWMGVLGNHDYGGTCVNMGWPQQVWYTWNQVSKRWVLPAQYYSRNIRFAKNPETGAFSEEDFTIDIFFLDSNHADVGTHDKDHDMCASEGNSGDGYYCAGFLGEEGSDYGQCAGTNLWGDADSCNNEFQSMWRAQMAWLEDGLNKSTADWQMIVTHFPVNYPTVATLLTPLIEKYGVDLVMCGHSHLQMVKYQEAFAGFDIGDTAWVISGGGGGITSEGSPSEDGHDDQYGFMDMVLTKDQLSINPYSWGETTDGSPILRKGAVVSPRARNDSYVPTVEAAVELIA